MLLAELAGPSGVGKSAIYEAVVASGEITPNVNTNLVESLNAISESEKFPILIERIAHTAQGPCANERCSFLYRSLYKHIIAARSKGKPMVIDGGLVQRGFAVEQLNCEVTLEEFWQAMPIPDVLFMVSADKNTILDRNKERGGNHDRSWQVDMAVAHFSRAYDALKERGVHIVSIDAMQPVEQNACIILDVLRGVSGKAQRTAIRYLGEEALRYEAKRAGTSKWMGEDRKVREFLDDLPEGTSVLDIPCGTGRFFPLYYERGFRILGVDISPGMVAEARKRAIGNITVEIGSIFNIEASRVFDAILCIRFLNLIEAEDLKRALAEMQRVAKSRIVFTLRVKQKNPTGHYHRPYAISLIEESLLSGWKIGRNEPVHEEDYRLIELVR